MARIMCVYYLVCLGVQMGGEDFGKKRNEEMEEIGDIERRELWG